MARIGILTCSNATQDLGCSSVVCLADLRKRQGSFAHYPQDEPLHLVGLMNCPGCPTLVGSDKLLQRVRGLTEFKVQAVHFSNCIKYLCPFKERYLGVLQEHFPQINFIVGTHAEHGTPEAFRQAVQGLFSAPRPSMIDLILRG